MKTCGNYREALIDAAAGAGEPSRELRSHLDACSSCRAAFIEEQKLFAAIDTGVRVSANAEVPASLLPRVRARLSEHPAPRHSWIPLGATLAAAITLVAVFVLVHGIRRDSAGSNPQTNPIVGGVAGPSETGSVRAPDTQIKTAGPILNAKRSRPIRKAHVQETEELTVLIPDGQKQAIKALLSSVRHGTAKANLLLAERAEDASEGAAVAPLLISPIELKPIADLSAEPSSEDGNATR